MNIIWSIVGILLIIFLYNAIVILNKMNQPLQTPQASSQSQSQTEQFVSSMPTSIPAPPIEESDDLRDWRGTYTSDVCKPNEKKCDYHNCSEEVSQIERERNEQMNRVCYFQHNHKKYKCDYGRTNYLHPSDLTTCDKTLFKQNYYDNMTLQDYVNWLQLYIKDGDEHKLCYEHYKNIEQIKTGQPLKVQQGVCPPSLDTHQSFCDRPLDLQQLYNLRVQDTSFQYPFRGNISDCNKGRTLDRSLETAF